MPTSPENTQLSFDQLSPYPHQAKIYGDLAEAAMNALIESMDRDGLREPIQVMPPDNAAG